MDVEALKANFAAVAEHGDAVALHFYADLFLRNPDARDLFPTSMAHQRDRLIAALGRIVSQVDDLDGLMPFVETLGRDHRRFGAEPAHYHAVGTSLIATLAHFSGDAWTTDLQNDWTAAYLLVAEAMMRAAEEDALTNPAWWDATVIDHENRTFDIAVMRMATTRRLTFRPGQAVSLECPQRPRLWRYYSIANAPRTDGTLDFHVKLIPGGPVSGVLVRQFQVGSAVRLGPPLGRLTLDDDHEGDLLFVAGSTGLAPFRALIDQLAAMENKPSVKLFFGARQIDELYDLPALEKLATEHEWLTVTPSVSADPDYPGECGVLADVVTRHGPWDGHTAYVCGSTTMVRATTERLVRLGLPMESIKLDWFGGDHD